MLTDTTAIVLKTIAFKESSLIVTLLSEKHGKTAVMARGARRNKNKFGGMLQPGALLDVSYYYKPTREVQNLNHINQKKPTWRIHQIIEKMAVGLATLELCEQLCHEHEPMPDVFKFLAGFLTWLHETENHTGNIFPYVQYQLAQLTGIGTAWKLPEPAAGNDIRHEESKGYINIESGCISDKPDDGLSFSLTKCQLQYLRCIKSGRKSKLLTDSYPAQDMKNLIHHFDAYFQYHMEGMKARKSDAIFEQIL